MHGCHQRNYPRNIDRKPQTFSTVVVRLFAKLDMGYEDISAMYFAKNLLNEYRQARGYKVQTVAIAK